MPGALRDPTNEVAEVVDLTDECEPLDADSFILEVLFVKEVKFEDAEGAPNRKVNPEE